MFATRPLAAALVAVLVASGPTVALAQGACVSRAEGRQLLEQGQVVPLPEAMRQAGLSSAHVMNVQLCRAGGGFVYRLQVLEDGKPRPHNIPAG